MTASRLVIDCDPGLDDAIAIALALASPEFQFDAIVTVSGNAGIDMVTANALGIVTALEATTPVYRGCGRPLVGEPRLGIARWGGTGSLGLSSDSCNDGKHLNDYVGLLWPTPVTLAAIGPLTNIARLLEAQPGAARQVDRLVIMGGVFGAGSTPPVEFNIWADPHAAQAVFASGMPLTLVPLNLTRQAALTPQLIERLTQAAGRRGALHRALLPLMGKPGYPAAVHDACAIGWLLWPELFQGERGAVTVETSDTANRGETRFAADPAGPHMVLMEIDAIAFLDRLGDRLAGD